MKRSLCGSGVTGERVRGLSRGCVPTLLYLLFIIFPGGSNACTQAPLGEIPLYLQRAVVLSEDHRFFNHNGTDFRAILRAIWQNMRAGRVVSGASTISEQLVKLEHNLPRTLRGRLSAAILAREMERDLSKDKILEQYLNRIPYQADACGVREGAKLLFGRELSTLSEKEMLALAVMIRAPGVLDPARGGHALERRIKWLAQKFPDTERVLAQKLSVIPRPEGIAALRGEQKLAKNERLGALLKERVRLLSSQNVQDGAVLAVRNDTGEILVYESVSTNSPAIDSVRVPRQAGSTLKPFLYALLLDQGVSAESRVIDAPLRLAVNRGVQSVRNYSEEFFGEVSLKEALGSSLNTPAVRVLEVVGLESFYQTLKRLGFGSLANDKEHYGEGIVIGNCEVSLWEMVHAYRVLARGGEGIFSAGSASEVTQILSNPDVRRFEFSVGGLLQFPEQTAVKTGTSSDHHDAWAVGYSPEFTVGVWMGNLDRTPMREVSGSKGPAWVLRAAFNELRRERGEPAIIAREHVGGGQLLPAAKLKITYPLDGIIIRRDKRIAREGVVFEVSQSQIAKWILNGEELGMSDRLLWYVSEGDYLLQATVADKVLEPVRFSVR